MIFIGGLIGYAFSEWRAGKLQKAVEQRLDERQAEREKERATQEAIRNYQHRQMWAWFRRMKGINGDHDQDQDLPDDR